MRKCCYYRYDAEMNITYNELQRILKNNSIIIVDVRSNQEFKEGHLDGAINIPLGEISQIDNIVKNKKSNIVVYCSSGIRSKKAQKKLEAIGYDNVYNLIDGV